MSLDSYATKFTPQYGSERQVCSKPNLNIKLSFSCEIRAGVFARRACYKSINMQLNSSDAFTTKQTISIHVCVKRRKQRRILEINNCMQ